MGKPVEVCVDNYFVADGNKLGACSGKTNNVTWATIIEKALINGCKSIKLVEHQRHRHGIRSCHPHRKR